MQTVADKKIETQIKQTDVGVRSLEKVDDDGNFRFKAENKRLQMEREILKKAAAFFAKENT